MNSIKKCTRCSRELPLDRFYTRRLKDGSIRYFSHCRDCMAVTATEWKKNNPDKNRATHAIWCKNNRDKCRAYDAKKRQNNPEKKRAQDARWRHNNIEKAKANAIRWQKNNPEKCRIRNAKWRRNNPGYQAKYERERRARDLSFRIMKNIKGAMGMALRNNVKVGHTVDLLGCSIEDLRKHLERLFAPGMTWEKYSNGEIHIDHIIPVSYFDFSDPEQQKRAWHYTNLQPLWAIDNLKKGNKIEERQMILL